MLATSFASILANYYILRKITPLRSSVLNFRGRLVEFCQKSYEQTVKKWLCWSRFTKNGTVKSHTDEKYPKSYLHTRVHDDRKIMLLMKGHPHEFGHTASWSCVAIASFWACKQNDRRALLWYPSFGTTHANTLLRAQ